MLDQASILVIDDEEVIQETFQALLAREACQVGLASTAEVGLELARKQKFDCVLLDLMLPGIDGLQALEEFKKFDQDLPVIMVTGVGTSENTRDAFKKGAFDFLQKPFKNEDVLVRVRNAVSQRRLVDENRALSQNLQAHSNHYSNIIGGGARIRRVFELIGQAAPSRTTILVTGESGTGKELVARAIHANSTRAAQPFVTVNSGSLPADLLESNLFGHVKGAFTGAVSNKKGLFEIADQGSIFFDEIGTVPLETQAKLLRVIQEREFMRLGGVDTIKVEVRIIAATNVDLRRMVDEGTFREDLFYRLHVITIELPPLRERREDVPLLVQSFLEKYGNENGKKYLKFTDEAMQLLEGCHWPGNVRELENVVERASVLTSTSTIGVDLIPDTVKTARSFQLPNFDLPPDGIPFRKIIEEMEGHLIMRALEASGGVQKYAAALLRIKPTTLGEMIKRYGIRNRLKKSTDTAKVTLASVESPSTDGSEMASGQSKTENTVSDFMDILDKRLNLPD